MDFLARATTGCCPAMAARSPEARSSDVALEVASPKPMFSTTFWTRGTCITFSYLNCSRIPETTSCWYLSFKRGGIPHPLPSYPYTSCSPFSCLVGAHGVRPWGKGPGDRGPFVLLPFLLPQQ